MNVDKSRESTEDYNNSVTLFRLTQQQRSAELCGNFVAFHRLQKRINAMERLSTSKPVRII